MTTMIKILGMALCVMGIGASTHAAETEYVFLVTGDGIRHQELFRGVDAELSKPENKKASGIEDVSKFRERFWADDATTRREKVMPFFWKELAKHGAIYGNRELGSKVRVSNPHHFSYPGYAEILNGQALKGVTSNDPNWSPRQTLLEFVKEEKKLSANDVAVFGSWSIFNWISMQREGAVFCNAGYERMPAEGLNERSRAWDQAQFDMLSPWDTVRHDAVTLNLALEYIKQHEPHFIYLALGETDDWAHNRRYDRTVETLAYFDDALKQLTTLIQSHPKYRDKTTLVITTDHGRGRKNEDWTSHNKDVAGADEAWFAIFGPDIEPKGEVRGGPEYTLANLAATMLKLLDLDPKKFNPDAASAVGK